MSRFIIKRDVPEKPHQPKTYRFPKRSFGQKTVVYHGFQPDWFSKCTLRGISGRNVLLHMPNGL